MSKYGPLTAIICLFLFGVLLMVLGDVSPRTDVLLARSAASPTQLSGRAHNPRNKMNSLLPSRAQVAATNIPTEQPSAAQATANRFAPQRLTVQASALQPKRAKTTSPPQEQQGLPPGVVYASNTDAVRILSVSLSPDTLQAGDIASARVITTSNAAALTARIGTYQVNVPKVAPGMFALSMTVPHIYVPGHRAVIVVTAIRADGATTQRSVPLDFSN